MVAESDNGVRRQVADPGGDLRIQEASCRSRRRVAESGTRFAESEARVAESGQIKLRTEALRIKLSQSSSYLARTLTIGTRDKKPQINPLHPCPPSYALPVYIWEL